SICMNVSYADDAAALGATAAGSRLTESPVSGTSWPAIFAGAITAAATSLILVVLGMGFGLASVSPWPHSGASATTFTVMTGIWLIIVQWLSAAMGGYV